MSRFRFLKYTTIALGALTLSGCVSLLPEVEPVAVYRLSSPEPRANATMPEAVVVTVERPVAPAGLSGDEIAIETEPGRLAYMAGARWIAPSTVILQSLIVDTLHAGEDGIEPVRPSDAIRGSYELRTDLRAFEAVYDQGSDRAPLVRVRIAARLVESDGRNLAASEVFSAEVRARANRAGAIVDAFNQASTQVATEMSAWTGATANR